MDNKVIIIVGGGYRPMLPVGNVVIDEMPDHHAEQLRQLNDMIISLPATVAKRKPPHRHPWSKRHVDPWNRG